jgi:hypothetical protein
MPAVVAVGVVLLVLAAMAPALRCASRPRGAVRHHSHGGDGGQQQPGRRMGRWRQRRRLLLGRGRGELPRAGR